MLKLSNRTVNKCTFFSVNSEFSQRECPHERNLNTCIIIMSYSQKVKQRRSLLPISMDYRSTLVIIVSSVYFIFRSIYIHIFGSVFCVCVLIFVSMWRCVWVIYRTIWMENVSYEFEIDRMTTMLKQSENHNEKLAHKNEFKSHTHRRRGHMTHRLIWLLTHHRTITSMCTCVRVLLLLLFLFHRKNSE